MPKTTHTPFAPDAHMRRALKLVQDGRPAGRFEGRRDGCDFIARADLFIIREAWAAGCDFEAEADGYGPGEGTHGDWSGIRDSTEDAIRRMLLKSLSHFLVIHAPR